MVELFQMNQINLLSLNQINPLSLNQINLLSLNWYFLSLIFRNNAFTSIFFFSNMYHLLYFCLRLHWDYIEILIYQMQDVKSKSILLRFRMSINTRDKTQNYRSFWSQLIITLNGWFKLSLFAGSKHPPKPPFNGVDSPWLVHFTVLWSV